MNGGIKTRCLTNLAIPQYWCGRRDLNSHAVKHWNLNPACLPIPPLPQGMTRIIDKCAIRSSEYSLIFHKRNHFKIKYLQVKTKKGRSLRSAFLSLVRKERLELSRREALEPKSSVSTNSTTSAKKWGGRWDLNPRQPESQSGALPTELRPP